MGTSSKAKIDISPHQIEEQNAVEKDGKVIIYHKNGNPQSVGTFRKWDCPWTYYCI